MRILHAVAALAGRRGLGRFRDGDLVTAAAGKPFVGAVEGEGRAAIVIETPERPPVRVVAGRALRPQGPIVHVAIPVTPPARLRCSLVGGAVMALFTGHGPVEAKKGEAREVVVEDHILRPALGVVATPAVVSLLPRVDVVGAVTPVAVLRQCLFANATRMTACARQLLVRPKEPKARRLPVIETHALPAARVVTGATVLSMPSPVHIIDAMTVRALLRGRAGLLAGNRRGMASLARNGSMAAAQGKIGAAVIEARVAPAPR